MTTLYTNAIRLALETGAEVEAFVHVEPGVAQRPRCLLLHGNPGSLLDWAPLVSRLSAVADVAAIDLPGFGRSRRTDSSPECLNLDRLAEHAVAAADALAWREPVFLVGHSHGGGVAQTAAVRHPERVAGLVLLGTLGAPAHASYRLLSLPGATGLARAAGQLFRYQALRPLTRAILQGVMKDIFSPEMVPREKLEHELALFAERPEVLVSMVHVALGRPSAQLLASAANIRCPTLFLHGAEDALVPAACARSIHDAILAAGGSSRFDLVPGAGHMLIEHQASEIASSIARFFS